MILDLPNNYWDFIMEYLPDYTRRDEVLLSDIYTRFLDGEELCQEDYDRFFKGRLRSDIETEFIHNEWKLFLEAFNAFSTRYEPGHVDVVPRFFIPSEELPINILPDSDGVYNVWYADEKVHFKTLSPVITSASDNTNFVFEVTGNIDDEKMEHFNNIFKKTVRKGETCFDIATADRMNYLHEIGCDINFVNTARDIARENLIKCGGLEMPAIVGAILKEFYFENSTGRTNMDDCIEYLAEQDIAGYGFDDLKATYRSKIANLLLCTFTGMRLGTKWNGRQDVNGGYIVVKNDGDVVAFHSTIADEFKDFLVAKMVMESPSHSRHKDMCIYKENGKYYLKLALQLRFALNR